MERIIILEAREFITTLMVLALGSLGEVRSLVEPSEAAEEE